MTEPTQHEQIEIYQTHLSGLKRRGQELHKELNSDPSSPQALANARAWHEDCGATINQLSGGSKAHWLARAFSGAFLKRANGGAAVEGASPAEIAQRLLDVLDQASATLAQLDKGSIPATTAQGPAPHRFDFVHNPDLRPVLEEAYVDSRRSLEEKDYKQSLLTSAGILEAIVTDALEHKGLTALAGSGAPAGKIADWSFNTRLAVAEKSGLIRGGCARLPEAARVYRDDNADGSPATVSERDAKVTGQVLHVVMKDLDPGR